MFHELWSGDQSPTYCLQTSGGKTGNTIIACNRHRSPVIQNMIMLLSQTISITYNLIMPVFIFVDLSVLLCPLSLQLGTQVLLDIFIGDILKIYLSVIM